MSDNENAKTSHYADTFNYFNSEQLGAYIDKAVDEAVDKAFAKHDKQDAIDNNREDQIDKALDEFISELIDSYSTKPTLLRHIDRFVLRVSRLALLAVVTCLFFAMLCAKYATNPDDLQYYTVTGALVTGVLFGIVPYWFYLERRTKYAQRKLVVGVVKT